MLTRRGWVPAGALRQGDNLVRYGGHENARALGNDHEATPPTTIAQVFDALAQLRPPERVQAVRLDFHGDGRDGDVDVARAAGDLCLGRFAPIREPLEDHVFETPAASRTRFCHECGHLVMITQRCGVCDAPVRGPRTAQYALDGGVARTKRLGELIRAFSALVPSGYLVLREIMALAGGRSAASEMKLPRRGQRARDPRFTDYSTDPAARGADDGRDVRDALAMEVEFERVSSCRYVEFRGHVYNLSTAHGYFTIAGGLYTGNTIFRTNVQTAFSHGRVRQMSDPAVLALRPFWLFDALIDGRQTDICEARNGVLLPATDPWWRENTPPLHFCCRSGIRSLRKSQAARRGGERRPDLDIEPPGDGFGAAPSLLPAVQVKPFVPEVKGHPALEGARLRKEREQRPLPPKPEHDPEHWVAEFRSRGYPEDVARRAAYGKAAEERGLDRPLDELRALAQRLEEAGVPAGRSLRESLDWIVEDGEVQTLRGQLALLAREGAPEHAAPGVRAMAAMLEHAHAIPPRRAPILMPGRPQDDPERLAEYRAAVGFYETLSHPALAHPTNYQVRWGIRRGYCDTAGRRLLLSRRPGVLVHEWGHAIEELNPEMLRRSAEFLRTRTAGELAQRLRDLYPGKKYKRRELAKPDKFLEAYMGKLYTHLGRTFGTELLSMAFDLLASGEGWRLRGHDADLFWFCLGQLLEP